MKVAGIRKLEAAASALVEGDEPVLVTRRVLCAAREAQKDPERLERWLEKAAIAASVTAVLDEPN